MTHETGFNTIETFRAESGGVLLIDKPLEWTSFDVVKKIRGMMRVKKVGHAGTLDPLASGLLILCSGKMTKSIDRYQALRKTYTGTLVFGAETESFDAAMPPMNASDISELTLDAMQKGCEAFAGDIMQLPPMYSAIQVEGQRLYKLARKGKTIERSPRPVTVFRFDIAAYSAPIADFVVECSKGTYVRSLAHDLGQALGCGAYLGSLRRTAIGEYRVEDAWTLERLQRTASPEILDSIALGNN